MEGGPQKGGLCQNTPRSEHDPADSPEKRNDEERAAEDSPAARAATEQQVNLEQTSRSHTRAQASFTASLSSRAVVAIAANSPAQQPTWCVIASQRHSGRGRGWDVPRGGIM
ncbi:unnamed protein product [Pleuronectes platessa]|uniref:Uncharacterized protein n=1 Tax=Pleuronectes platessa TaxID=8262 RepID=A0A9N7V9L0_PLEPL|nr:unnamed protein product [Pleuronectes platessa]